MYVLRENQENDGPFSLRDIDVMYKTLSIRSNTLVWKEGMEEWKPLFKVDELRKHIDEAVAETEHIPDINATSANDNHNNLLETLHAQKGGLEETKSSAQLNANELIPSSEEIRKIVSSAIEQIGHEQNLIDIPDEELNEEEKKLKHKQIEKEQK